MLSRPGTSAAVTLVVVLALGVHGEYNLLVRPSRGCSATSACGLQAASAPGLRDVFVHGRVGLPIYLLESANTIPSVTLNVQVPPPRARPL